MVSFDAFLAYFPEIELPVTLNDETQVEFSRVNTPFHQQVVEEFLIPLNEQHNELTEYVPCFKVPETFQFHAVVYWMASPLNYQYCLVTFTKEGELIDKKVLAGTYSSEGTLTKAVATFDEDWIISVATGQNNRSDLDYDPKSSKIFKLELLPEGTIINPS